MSHEAAKLEKHSMEQNREEKIKAFARALRKFSVIKLLSRRENGREKSSKANFITKFPLNENFGTGGRLSC
jgi:hypothetical protein